MQVEIRLPKVDDTYMEGVLRAFPSVSLDTAKPASYLEHTVDASYRHGVASYRVGEKPDYISAENDPLGIGPTRLYDLSRDNVTLVNNPEINGYLEGVLKDTVPLWEASQHYETEPVGNKITFAVDSNLPPSTLAYVVDIPEIMEADPKKGRELEDAYGPYPLMALNHQLIEQMNRDIPVAYTRGMVPDAVAHQLYQLRAILGHEKFHLGQKGKGNAKQVYYPVLVNLGEVYMPAAFNVGEALVEGGVEIAMKARAKKLGYEPPTSFFPENALYNRHREFVGRVEQRSPGFVKGFLRIARNKGVRAAEAYLRRAGIDDIIGTYISELTGAEVEPLPA